MKVGWEIKKLGEVCSVAAGQGAPQGDANYCLDGIPFIKAGNLEDLVNGLPELEVQKVSDEVAKQHRLKIYKAGSVVFAKSGMSCMKGHVYSLRADCYVVSHLAILTPHGISTAFLKYILTFHRPNTLVKDSAYPSISLEDIKAFPIPVPSRNEQEKIVAELDCLSGIIEKKKQQLKELDALAQSIFNETFMHMEGSPIKLSQACAVVSGLVNPNEEPYCDYPHIGGANIESHTGQFVNVMLAKEENLISGKYPFDETMILYSKIRPNLNKVALPSFKGVCSADMYPLIPKDGFNKVFLKYIFTQKAFLEYAISHSGRANIPKINREDLLNYEFLTYPIQEQRKFASKIEAIEKQKELIKQSIQETETLFNSRMDYYFN